jgi:gas vesicle protein
MMIFGDLLDLVNKEKRKRERVNTARKVAVGIGVVAAVSAAAGILLAPKSGRETREDIGKNAVNAVATIKDTVRKKVETVKGSVAQATQKVCKELNEGHEKQEMAQDISSELHNPVK